MVSNLTLKAKLQVLVVIMITILSFFALNIIYEKHQKKVHFEELKISVDLSTYFSKCAFHGSEQSLFHSRH